MLEINAKIISFFKKIFIFSKLPDDQLIRVIRKFEVIEKNKDENLYEVGDPCNFFYIVWQGKIVIFTEDDESMFEWGTLILGDFLGEDLLLHEFREENAKIVEKAMLFRIHREALMEILGDFPEIEAVLSETAHSRALARDKKFRWLSKDEIVYIIERKHVFFLGTALIIPVLFTILFIVSLGWSLASQNNIFKWGSIIGLVLSVFSIIWVWIDWGNDYAAVTSRRVLSIEKIALIYDNRLEAPLDTILSTNITWNQTLRMLINYGNVIVKTFTGSIAMRKIKSPNLLVLYINGLKLRAGELARQYETEIMQDLIRKRLNPEEESIPEDAIVEQESKTDKENEQIDNEKEDDKKKEGGTGFLGNFLKVRYVQGDTIIYRKHWFVLFKRIWWQLLLMGLIFFAGAYLTKIAGVNILVLALLFLIFIILFGIMLYRYVDWKNDIYLVTLDHILDIERKPLGSENKKSATLDNILSLENERVGIFGILLNYGTVIINVGTEKFDFHGVYNPAQVQYEIFDRMVSLRHRKEQKEAAKERERIADWLAIYHEQVKTLEDLEKSEKGDAENG